ncbi:MAG TPA: Ger(x)C family spore germination protein [Bacillota bacterium]|nr:Ger(x)C family spore germination protein [Bacillota bacterium]
MRHKWLFLGLILLITLFSGCWDISEINRRTIVVALGLDATEDGKVKVSLQIPLAQSVSARTETNQPPTKTFYTITNEAESPMAAIEGLQSKTGNDLFYGQLKVVIFGASLARNGLLAITDFLQRVPVLPPQGLMLLADGVAEEIISKEVSSREVPGLVILNFLEQSAKSDLAFPLSGWQLVRGVNFDTEDIFLPVISFEPQEETFIIKGIGVFHHDRLVGILSDTETRMFGFLTGRARNAAPSLVAQHSNVGLGRVSYRVMANTKTKAFVDGEQLRFLVNVKLKGSLVESTKAETRLSLEEVRELEKAAEQKFKSEMMKTVRHLQELNSDVLGFGELLRAMHPKAYRRLNWDREFPRVPVQVKVKFNLEQSGSFR